MSTLRAFSSMTTELHEQLLHICKLHEVQVLFPSEAELKVLAKTVLSLTLSFSCKQSGSSGIVFG